jgi:hypothetical protein
MPDSYTYTMAELVDQGVLLARAQVAACVVRYEPEYIDELSAHITDRYKLDLSASYEFGTPLATIVETVIALEIPELSVFKGQFLDNRTEGNGKLWEIVQVYWSWTGPDHSHTFKLVQFMYDPQNPASSNYSPNQIMEDIFNQLWAVYRFIDNQQFLSLQR